MQQITFLTHASKHYDAQYKVLERSIKLHEPNAALLRFEPVGNADGFTYINGLPRQRFSDVLFLLEQKKVYSDEKSWQHDVVILIGADCVLFNSIAEITNTMNEEHGENIWNELPNIYLTSHINHPTDTADVKNVPNYYRCGMINGDFIVFNNTEETKKILRWLISQDTDTNEISEGKFYEQTYLSALPFIFDGVKILRDDTVNVAWYNLNERNLTFNNDAFQVNKQPLKMFHFSGYEIDKPEQLTRYAQINPANTPFAVSELLNWYGLELQK